MTMHRDFLPTRNAGRVHVGFRLKTLINLVFISLLLISGCSKHDQKEVVVYNSILVDPADYSTIARRFNGGDGVDCS